MVYAKGIGMKVTSWQYPAEGCLRGLIEKKKLYPITILKTINDATKFKLVNSGIILAISLLDYDLEELKKKTGISENILKKILEEASGICKVNV